MDVSGFEECTLREIARYDRMDISSEILRFQNHLYGCFSALELIAENNFDISGFILGTGDDSFDLSGEFATIGLEFGFLCNEAAAMHSYSQEYNTAWKWAWMNIGTVDTLHIVDTIERSIFDAIGKSTIKFFTVALENVHLSDEYVAHAEHILCNTVTHAQLTSHRCRHTRRVHGRRSITPMRRRRFHRTRRRRG